MLNIGEAFSRPMLEAEPQKSVESRCHDIGFYDRRGLHVVRVKEMGKCASETACMPEA